MPAIFHLTLPVVREEGPPNATTAEAAQCDTLPYSGRLSFDGGFDRFGFTPQRELRAVAGPSDLHTPLRRH